VVIYTMGTTVFAPVLPTDPGRTMPVDLMLKAQEGINLPSAYGEAFLLVLIVLVFNLIARWIGRRNRRMQG
jgi:phosphate transport system permease protein